MKKAMILCVSLALLTACDMFKKDNYKAPDARFHGRIVDEATGENVETDIVNGSVFRWQELGDEWTTGWNTRVIKQNGEFRDNLMFSGRYKMEFHNSNFFPFTRDEIVIRRGDNEMDFAVTPYIRVKNAQIVRDEAAKVIRATFTLEAGDPRVRLNDIRLYAATDIYVGEPFTTFNTGGAGFRQSFSPAKEIVPGESYTLTIDLTNDYNAGYFKYRRNYYFRVGAKAADIPGMGTIRRNYAPHTVILFGN